MKTRRGAPWRTRRRIGVSAVPTPTPRRGSGQLFQSARPSRTFVRVSVMLHDPLPDRGSMELAFPDTSTPAAAGCAVDGCERPSVRSAQVCRVHLADVLRAEGEPIGWKDPELGTAWK